jgi:hypothetical protein
MSILILGLLFITFCMPAQNGALLAAETIPFLSSDSSEQFLKLKDLPANDSGLSSMEYGGESDSYYEGLGKLKIELALDGFKVWPDWVQINASFSVVYQFDLGKDSHPTNILLLTGERHIDTKAAEACLAKWTFSGLLPKKNMF